MTLAITRATLIALGIVLAFAGVCRDRDARKHRREQGGDGQGLEASHSIHSGGI